MKLPSTDEELRELAQSLGLSTQGLVDPNTGKTNAYELQARIINMKRSIREGRLWWIALISAIASILSAGAAWMAVLWL